ncbi:MAG: hypothetical protein H0U59_05090 [Gemmatimonadaceae bacterium]|nr:hypothetical protein [Gemmatimonadaceae bacterium]
MTTLFAQTRLCGFGDVKFGVLWGGDPYGMPGWAQESYANTVHIPGGNVNETFLMGLSPLTITYDLVLDTKDDYRALAALQQASGTLTVYTAMCELAGREVVLFGQAYTELDNTLLIGLSRQMVRVDGAVECSATFQLDEVVSA